MNKFLVGFTLFLLTVYIGKSLNWKLKTPYNIPATLSCAFVNTCNSWSHKCNLILSVFLLSLRVVTLLQWREWPSAALNQRTKTCVVVVLMHVVVSATWWWWTERAHLKTAVWNHVIFCTLYSHGLRITFAILVFAGCCCPPDPHQQASCSSCSFSQH